MEVGILFLYSLFAINDKNVKDSFVFDFYKNEALNQVKVGVRIIFQSNKKTLSESEIFQSTENIIKPIFYSFINCLFISYLLKL